MESFYIDTGWKVHQNPYINCWLYVYFANVCVTTKCCFLQLTEYGLDLSGYFPKLLNFDIKRKLRFSHSLSFLKVLSIAYSSVA